MIRLYQNQQIRDIEALVIKKGIHTEYDLMQAAAQAAWRNLQNYWPGAKDIAIFCGKGNNGGDGFALARLIQQHGVQVTVYSVFEIDELKPLARQMAEEARAFGVKILSAHSGFSQNIDVIVDALLGSGLKGEVQNPYAAIINAINDAKIPVLSLDAPSGVDVDTGNIHGCAIQADVTVTFIGRKPGLYTHKAPVFCGEIICNDLGISQEILNSVDHFAELLEWNQVKQELPRRRRDAHKGDFGHVLVIGGDYGMGGAVRMAAEAAMRVGAGLVTVATRPEHVTVVNCSRPEIMCHQVQDQADLENLMKRATVIVIGPGLGKSEWAKMLFHAVLKKNLPMVLDADSLNLMSQESVYSQRWVLTPHPGEAARLLGITSQKIQNNRFWAAQEIQKKYGGIVVLKGAGTIIQSPEQKPQICGAGNPGMASGGMGDVLSGVIGGLIAQGLDLQKAAESGVLIHSMAADQAALEGGERGLLATDLINHLRELVNP